MSTSAGRKVFSVTGVATLPARIRLRAMLVDLLMDRLEEMLRLEKVGDAIERLVVDEDRAQQRLLGLDIVRGGAIGRRGVRRRLARGRLDAMRCHDVVAIVLLESRRRSGSITRRRQFRRQPIAGVPDTTPRNKCPRGADRARQHVAIAQVCSCGTAGFASSRSLGEQICARPCRDGCRQFALALGAATRRPAAAAAGRRLPAPRRRASSRAM